MTIGGAKPPKARDKICAIFQLEIPGIRGIIRVSKDRRNKKMFSSYWVVHHMSNTTCPIWVTVLIGLALAGMVGFIIYDMIKFYK